MVTHPFGSGDDDRSDSAAVADLAFSDVGIHFKRHRTEKYWGRKSVLHLDSIEEKLQP